MRGQEQGIIVAVASRVMKECAGDSAGEVIREGRTDRRGNGQGHSKQSPYTIKKFIVESAHSFEQKGSVGRDSVQVQTHATRRNMPRTRQSRRRGRNRSVAVASLAFGLATLLDAEQHCVSTHAFAPPRQTMRLPQHSPTLLRHSNDVGGIQRVEMPPTPIHRLTHSEEVALLTLMRSYPAQSGAYRRARDTLVLRNLPLVHSIVSKIMKSRSLLRIGGGPGPRDSRGTALTRDDLVNEGTIGLCEAIDKYDLSFADGVIEKDAISPSPENMVNRGARLGTYATYWIRARITRAIQSREHAMRFPEHVLQASHRLVKTAKEFGVDWELVTELAEFDGDAGVYQTRLREKLRNAAGIKSDSLFREAVRVRGISSSSTAQFESWMAPASAADEELVDMISPDGGQEHIRETLAKFLGPREVEVLSLRFGIGADEDEPVGETPQRLFRDYQAEAEKELFGPNGILSHYSEVPHDSPLTATQPESGTKRQTSASISAKPALLPFKEIGKRMKFSGEYCRRTCSIALKKLTQAAEAGDLAEADFMLGFEF